MLGHKQFSKLFILLTALFLSGCASTGSYIPEGLEQHVSLKEVCEKNGIDWEIDSSSQVIKLSQNGNNARAMVGSSIVIVNKQKVYLDMPVMMVKSSVVVPADFSSKVLYPLRRKAQRKRAEKKIKPVEKLRNIVIDAGHGGKDPGAIGKKGTYEKDVVLDISKKVRKILQRNGYKVSMTRSTDKFITLQKRTEIASNSKADLFVSIHANASPSRRVQGVEVFSSKDLSFEDKNEDTRIENIRTTLKKLKMKRNDPDLDSIIEDMLYTHKQNESASLAEEFSSNIAGHVRAPNRGGKESRFFVLRNTLVPAVLIEVGFLSNPREERLLNTEGYRQKLAEAIAEGVIDYAQ